MSTIPITVRTAVRTTAGVVAVSAIALIAPLGASAVAAPISHQAGPVISAPAKPATSAVKIWVNGHYTKGADLDVFAYPGNDSHGRAFTHAVVVGPHGIKVTLTPAADAGYLVGTVHVPAALRGSWMRLTLITPDGHRASVVVTKAASKPAHSAPVKVWADRGYDLDGFLDVYAYPGNDRHGKAFRSARVVGPDGISGVLTPAADRGYLVGSIQVPDAVRGATIRLTLITPDGHRATMLTRPAGR